MSFSQSLNVEDYLLYKEFQEFKKNKELQKSIDNTTTTTDNTTTTTDNTTIDNIVSTSTTILNSATIDNTIPSRAISNSSMTAFTMQDMIAMTPVSVLDSQVVLNKKVVNIIDSHFTDTSYNDKFGRVIKFATSYTYSQDASGQLSIMVPSLSLVNIPSFSFSSFNFNVSLEGRGFDSSKNILVSPTQANSRFAMYNINGQMLDRGEPIGLTRLKILLSETIIQSTSAPPVKKSINGVNDMMFDTRKF
jgi:hypothetical protein